MIAWSGRPDTDCTSACADSDAALAGARSATATACCRSRTTDTTASPAENGSLVVRVRSPAARASAATTDALSLIRSPDQNRPLSAWAMSARAARSAASPVPSEALAACSRARGESVRSPQPYGKAGA
jgi:hypothetical protein